MRNASGLPCSVGGGAKCLKGLALAEPRAQGLQGAEPACNVLPVWGKMRSSLGNMVLPANHWDHTGSSTPAGGWLEGQVCGKGHSGVGLYPYHLGIYSGKLS
jgi:hypothetical protein